MKELEEIIDTPLWYQFYNWRENPFRIKVGEDQIAFLPLPDVDKQLFESVVSGDILNVVGGPGTGKTEHALQLQRVLIKKGSATAYIDLSGTEGDVKSFCDQLFDEIPLPLFKKFPKKRAPSDITIKHLKNISRKRKTALLIDEAQNITNSNLTDLLRRITDQCENVAIILLSIQDLLSLPVFKESIRRRMKVLQMRELDGKEVEELIRRKITRVGGDGNRPLHPEVIEFIRKRARNIPGMVLRYCEELCIKNFHGKKALEINLENALTILGEETLLEPIKKIKEVKVVSTPTTRESIVHHPEAAKAQEEPLTNQAKRVLEKLSQQQQNLLLTAKIIPEFTVEDLVLRLHLDSHSISTQMRRISKKLGTDVFIVQRKEGKKIIWKLSDNYRILFAAS